MKVISTPDVDGWSFHHTCSSCDSKLAVEASDLDHRYNEGNQRDPGYDSFTACCAICKTGFSVPTNSIPKLIQIKVKGKKVPSGSYYDR